MMEDNIGKGVQEKDDIGKGKYNIRLGIYHDGR